MKWGQIKHLVQPVWRWNRKKKTSCRRWKELMTWQINRQIKHQQSTCHETYENTDSLWITVSYQHGCHKETFDFEQFGAVLK